MGGVYAEKWAEFTKELAVMVVRSDTEVRSFQMLRWMNGYRQRYAHFI
jgi:phosphoribosylaminoimidazole carboxylase (NCAIR synthetase)